MSVTKKKWKVEHAVLTHSTTQIANLGGQGAPAVAYGPDIGEVVIKSSGEVVPLHPHFAGRVKRFYDELAKSTAMSTLIIRSGGSVPKIKKSIASYRSQTRST